MQPRFAALVFVLGLADLAYVNLGVGPQVLANGPAPAPASAVEMAAPARGTLLPSPSRSVNALSPIPAEAPKTPEPEPPAPEPSAPPAQASVVEAPPSAAPSAGGEPLQEFPPSHLQVDLRVAFPAKGSALLTAEAREELLRLAQQLRENPHRRLRVIGHADARGTSQFNRYLGIWRARAVSQLLEAAGVAPEQVEMESRGEDEPLVSGASEEAWAANRRVEISIGNTGSEGK
jgi:peptidoglycan-associated lipoprotein